MAKRSSSKKASKHYPVQRKLRIAEEQPSVNSQTMLIATDYLLSQVNHRLYRQSRLYRVSLTIDGDLPDGTSLDVYALSDTWMNKKAYQMAKAAFDKNSAEELAAMGGSSKARWHDFRVNDGFTGAVARLGVELQGQNSQNFLTIGESEAATVTDAGGVERSFRWVGSGGATFNIVDEYDRTGNTQTSPSNVVTTMGYESLEDELDSLQVEHLSGDGNSPPYNANTIENEVFSHVARLYVTSAGDNKIATGYFNAPCGIIYIQGGAGTTSLVLDGRMTLEVQKGDYKGIHAPSYLE